MKNLFKNSIILILGLIVLGLTGFDVHSFANFTDTGISMAIGAAMLPRDRALFKHLKAKYPEATPSPSYLRIEQALSNSKGVYEFRFMKTDNEAITEVKLDRNDVFVVTDLAVYLLAQDSTKIGMGVLQTFVNQQVFASATGFTPTHLETIYSGKLELKVGDKINIAALSMQEFRVVPETQQSSSTNLSQSYTQLAKYKPDTLIYLRGDGNNVVTIQFPTFSGMAIAAVASNTTNKLVFHPYGYLIRNAAR